MNRKATIFDYARMCESNKSNCECCPLSRHNNGIRIGCVSLLSWCTDKANEIILKWCDEHPVETRQDRFLKLFPNAMKDEAVINIDPCIVDETLCLASPCWECAEKRNIEDCEECRKHYWLAEVDE